MVGNRHIVLYFIERILTMWQRIFLSINSLLLEALYSSRKSIGIALAPIASYWAINTDGHDSDLLAYVVSRTGYFKIPSELFESAGPVGSANNLTSRAV